MYIFVSSLLFYWFISSLANIHFQLFDTLVLKEEEGGVQIGNSGRLRVQWRKMAKGIFKAM